MDSYGLITLGKFGLLRATLLFVGVSVGGLVIVACLCVLIWWCLVVFVASAVVGGVTCCLDLGVLVVCWWVGQVFAGGCFAVCFTYWWMLWLIVLL